jgi:hypothetical protein
MCHALSETSIPVREYTGKGAAGQGLGIILPASQFVHQITPNLNATTGEPLPFSTSQLDSMVTSDYIWLSFVTADEGLIKLVLQISVTTFFAAFMAWLGWFLFAFWGE